jgi:hypothetical protein
MFIDVAATRVFHMPPSDAEQKVRAWLDDVFHYSTKAIVAADSPISASLLPLQRRIGARLRVITIDPWIGYSAPLNVVLAHAATLGARTLLLQSLDVRCTRDAVQLLYALLDDATLVAGARMTQEHAPGSGLQPINAINSPWNTLALWQISKLRLAGFCAIADSDPPLSYGGMEEVATISILQHLYPGKMRAVVADAGSISWKTPDDSPPSFCRHWRKMASKLVRAESQLQLLNVPRGMVETVDGFSSRAKMA